MLWLLLSVSFVGLAQAQLDAFALPQASRYAPKPTVPPEFSKYFELDGHARELVDSLLGPRPGGLFPEKTFEIGSGGDDGNGPVHVPSTLEKTLENFFTAPETNQGAFPPGFGSSGFSLLNDNKSLAKFGGSGVRRAPEKKKSGERKEESHEEEGSGEAPKSSISGIPKIFPKIPISPFNQQKQENQLRETAPIIANSKPFVPQIQSAPEVPEGGFLPADIRRAPQHVGEVASSIDDPEQEINADEYGGLSDETSTGSGGLIGTIIKMIGMGAKHANDPKESNVTTTESPEKKNALGLALSRLLGGEDSPLPGKNVISNLLYKTLTSGSVQSNETTTDDNNGTIVLSPAQSAAIGENLEMVKNLIIQPSSPLCTSKPQPVEFDLESFMGQWYQVVHSPPMSAGPCSMVAYKKLSSVNDGGVGSIFEIFEYATDGSTYGKPKITSGYSIIKSPGELIYRTTSNQEDVIIYVLNVGPKNEKGEYEYAIMAANCNYPIYVFARDPVAYKQKYEEEANAFMEKRGLVNGFSRLLNIVAPVDNTMCIFPPSLFNIAGK